MATITSNDPRLKSGKKRVKKFNIKWTVTYQGDLELDEIWPDDDAPDNPTAEDVIKVIVDFSDDLTTTMCEWNMTEMDEVESQVEVNDIPIRAPQSTTKGKK